MERGEVLYLIELPWIYDGWSVRAWSDGSYENRWADPRDPSKAREGLEGRFAVAQAWIDKQNGEPHDHE